MSTTEGTEVGELFISPQLVRGLLKDARRRRYESENLRVL
jgi:hypothetical protein